MSRLFGWVATLFIISMGWVGAYQSIYLTPYEYCVNYERLWGGPPYGARDCEAFRGTMSLAEMWGWR